MSLVLLPPWQQSGPATTGLQTWLEARFLTGYSAGDPVGTWPDSYGSNSATATGTQRPTYATGFSNGQPALQFSGAQIMSITSLSLSTFTVFVIWTATSHGALYEHSINTNLGNGHYLYTGSGASLQVQRSSFITGKNLSSTWGLSSTPRLARHEYGGTDASHKLYLNGAVQTLTAQAGNSADPGTATLTTGFYIGARSSGPASLLTGKIAALLVYSPVLSATDAAQTESYLRGIYNF